LRHGGLFAAAGLRIDNQRRSGNAGQKDGSDSNSLSR
jgi:hypothetical protein